MHPVLRLNPFDLAEQALIELSRATRLQLERWSDCCVLAGEHELERAAEQKERA